MALGTRDDVVGCEMKICVLEGEEAGGECAGHLPPKNGPHARVVGVLEVFVVVVIKELDPLLLKMLASARPYRTRKNASPPNPSPPSTLPAATSPPTRTPRPAPRQSGVQEG